MLGVWVREHVDAGLPERPARKMGIVLRESVSLAGIWSLCWFAGVEALGGTADADRRWILLDVLTGGCAAGRDLFLPVLTPAEARQDETGLLDGLRRRYPALQTGSVWFVDDPERGLVTCASPRLHRCFQAPQ